MDKVKKYKVMEAVFAILSALCLISFFIVLAYDRNLAQWILVCCPIFGILSSMCDTSN